MNAGQLRKHEQVSSRYLRNRRDVIVYLPPGYDEQPQRRFPLLLLHDGQNLFDPATAFIPGNDWHVGQTAEEEIRAGRVQPLIIAGIYNTGKTRIQEYTPTRVARLGGGRADRYGKFLVRELKPYLARQYRTLDGAGNNGLGGSSLGGLVSLYIGLKMPEVFGQLAALSPSVWWNQRVINRFVAAATVTPRPRIWLDVGTREGGRTLQDVEQFRDVLVAKGWQPEHDLHYERIPGGEHNELAWAQRVALFLRFLFPGK